MDGAVFDDAHESEPAEFALSQDLIPGYAEGLMLMREGARWELVVPPGLAYGLRGRPSSDARVPAIEPNATLIFEVERLALQVGD